MKINISGECFSVEKIAEHFKMLKRGKTAGVDTLTAEHILYLFLQFYITCYYCCLN